MSVEKGQRSEIKPDVLATTANHPDERSQISGYGWMQPTYMRSVSFWGKFTSGSRISASRSDLLKVPTNKEITSWKARAYGIRHELLKYLKSNECDFRYFTNKSENPGHNFYSFGYKTNTKAS